jgi:hypothetical protein
MVAGASGPARGADEHSRSRLRGADRSPCTWYASPKGSVRSGGRSERRTTTLRYAANRATAGDVVCLLGGIYRLVDSIIIKHGGTPNAPIVFRSYRGRATITPARPLDAALIRLYAPAAYLEFSNLSFDGGTTNAWEGVFLGNGVHHVRLLSNYISNMSAAGLATSGADYVTFVGNRIYRFGDGIGWASGISFNSSVGAFWYDRAPGFHTVIANNIIAGGVDNSDHHSDGNGIIVDLGRDIAPVLIANNLVYQNGGRCIQNLGVNHVWVVNNTCYMNGLDSRLGMVGEIQTQNVQDVHIINNVAVAWTNRYPYRTDRSSEVTFSHNVAFGGLPSLVPPEAGEKPAAVQVVDPRFLAPIPADTQWLQAVPVGSIGSRFRLSPTSPLRTAGVDPRGEPAITTQYRSALDRILERDLAGNARPMEGRYSVGAYHS